MQDEPHSSQSKKGKRQLLKRNNHYNHYILFIFLTKRIINLNTLFSLGKYTVTRHESPTLPTTSHLWVMTVKLIITQDKCQQIKGLDS